MALYRFTYSTGYASLMKAVIYDGAGLWYTVTPAVEAYNASHIVGYGISVTENSPGQYQLTIPAALPAKDAPDQYRMVIYQTAASTLAVADLEEGLREVIFGWDGTDMLEYVTPDGGTVDNLSVTVSPIQASSANPRLSTRKLATIPQGTAPSDIVVLTDSQGDPVDLSGKTLRMVVASVTDEGDADDRTDDEIEAIYKYETGDGLTVQGADDNNVLIQHDAANTTTCGSFRYWLLDVTDADQPFALLKGTFDVEPAATDV